ncbi:MAG: YbaK/EbsC family protein [Armatimonadota bacterium]|nr:YbaK/EbsC family protein [Armatimonadota bacterium]MDR7468392.1 YbaK/EbsC family protein [Armatimonadota bacterium]MDR7494991.1 YbaK/EbsC family protein [Armatimonadota bacterium]MDR7548034.1 YbaK/EbsC family protein [Armatimonadota bacterium]MDR7559569.1 YbaK/EbsC family protein [Armatimonadota bacterium]
MSSATERVLEALQARGLAAEITEFPQSTRTAAEAAAAVGTSVAQIVKSLVFLADGRPVLVLASGANRVDPVKLAAACGAHSARRADAETVRAVTGFAIGGVPPVGHATPLPVILDRDLLRYEVVYAAAGTPHAVFPIAPDRLREITGAAVADIKET